MPDASKWPTKTMLAAFHQMCGRKVRYGLWLTAAKKLLDLQGRGHYDTKCKIYICPYGFDHWHLGNDRKGKLEGRFYDEEKDRLWHEATH